MERHGRFDPDAHSFGKVELCTFTPQFKRELFPNLRRAFEASMPNFVASRKALPVRIPVSRVIREDLHQMQQVLTNGTYNYWSPRTRNGHSDRCTALALAIRAAADGNSGPVSYGKLTRIRGRKGGFAL